jgi:hypothetical protein
MTIVHFAEMLRDSINEKINECRNDIHESHNPIYNDSLLIEIRTLEWVQGQISDLVNKEEKNIGLVIKNS